MKTAIVTGASSGLGKAVTKLLTKESWQVFALARSVKQADFGDKVEKIVCDIRSLSDIDQAFKIIDQEATSIDLLVNCAGRALVKTLEETSRKEIIDVLRVNLEGNIYIAQEVYKRMIQKQSGHIINIGSSSSIKARANEVLYCASKWGLRGFTKSLQAEGKQHNVKVTGVYPGGMKSENFWKVVPGKDISGYMESEAVAKQIVKIVNQGDEVAIAEVVIARP